MSITSDRIYKLRSQADMSRAELSRKMNVSKTTIQKWEEGATDPRRDKLEKLSHIFNVSEKYLLGFSKFEDESELINEAFDAGQAIFSLLGFSINMKLDDAKEVPDNQLYIYTKEIEDTAFNLDRDERGKLGSIAYNFLLLSNDERDDLVKYSEFVLSKKGYIVPDNKDN
jgi:Predicted transcription factor, homolog of eukaryotic MBF1